MTTPRPSPPCPPPTFVPDNRRALLQVWATLLGNIRTRRELLELSEGQLRDVGLTRGQALREAWKPVWRNTAQPACIETDRTPEQDGTPYAAIG